MTENAEEMVVSLVLSSDEEGQGQEPQETSQNDTYRNVEEDIEKKEKLIRKLHHSKDLEQSVEVLEQVLMSKLQLYGPDGEEVFDTCEELTLAYNTLAMKLIDKEEFDSAHELLKKAEVLTDKDSELSRTRKSISRLRAVTFNNLGCLYKHRRNFYTAIKYLEKAISIEESTSYAENPASTHLNLCATLSKCGRHDKALAYAKSALKILNNQLSLKTTSTLDKFKEVHDADTCHPKLLSTLAIAYHSAATQHEYLNQYEEANNCYRQAKVVGGLCWGTYSPMFCSLKQAYDEFRGNYFRYKKTHHMGKAPATRRPMSAGPRLGSGNPISSPSKGNRKKKQNVKKFENVSPDTLRIYRGESVPVPGKGKENIVIPSAPSKMKNSRATRDEGFGSRSERAVSTRRRPMSAKASFASGPSAMSPKPKESSAEKRTARSKASSSGKVSQASRPSSARSPISRAQTNIQKPPLVPVRRRPDSARPATKVPSPEIEKSERKRPSSARPASKVRNPEIEKANRRPSSARSPQTYPELADTNKNDAIPFGQHPGMHRRRSEYDPSKVGVSFLKRYAMHKLRQESIERHKLEALVANLNQKGL